jgi:hypothetical protein
MDVLSGAQWISGPDYDYGSDDAFYYEDHRNHVLSRTFTLTLAILSCSTSQCSAMRTCR